VRHLLVTVVVATMLAACGGATATPVQAPTASPSVIATVGASSAPPTATLELTSSPSSAGASGSGGFLLAGLATTLEVNAGPPDPSTFVTSFASETPTIFVPYQLAPGLSGKVTSTWKFFDGEKTVISFDYPASGPWAYFRLTYQEGFIPGDYQEVLTFDATGESVTLPFTITGPRKPPATPAPLPSGTSAFTLLRAATASDTSQPLPDTTTFTDSFATTAPAIYVVFALQSGVIGTVTCTMTMNGSALIEPLSLDYGTNNSWGSFKVTPAGTFPAGDYVATVTYKPTGESMTVTFTVK
jgi:hypothetical protein